MTSKSLILRNYQAFVEVCTPCSCWGSSIKPEIGKFYSKVELTVVSAVVTLEEQNRFRQLACCNLCCLALSFHFYKMVFQALFLYSTFASLDYL